MYTWMMHMYMQTTPSILQSSNFLRNGRKHFEQELLKPGILVIGRSIWWGRISKPGDCLPPKVAGKTNKNSKEIGDDDSLWRSPHQTCHPGHYGNLDIGKPRIII